jgi:Mitochondrial function, CLU-N-term
MVDASSVAFEATKPPTTTVETAEKTSDKEELAETTVPVVGMEDNMEETPTDAAADNVVILNDLLILPPLNKSIDDDDEGTAVSQQELLDAVPLPPIRSEEPVSSLRTALGEVCGFAHLTNYRLELVPRRACGLERKQLIANSSNAVGTNKNKTNKNKNNNDGLMAASPYTGTNAVVSVATVNSRNDPSSQYDNNHHPLPTQKRMKKKNLVLDDFGDLSLLLEDGLQDGSAFRIVLEKYDAASVRDHIARFRALLDGNAPTVTTYGVNDNDATATTRTEESLSEPTTQNNHENPEDDHGDAPVVEQPEDPATSTTEATDENNKNASTQEGGGEVVDKAKELEKREQETAHKTAMKLPVYDLHKPVAMDGHNLADFFYLACGEDPDLYHGNFPPSNNNNNKGTNKGTNNNNHGDSSSSNNNNNKSNKNNKKNNKNNHRNKSPSPPSNNNNKEGIVVAASSNNNNKDPKDHNDEEDLEELPMEEVMRNMIPRMNALEETTRVPCYARYSGYHPPPSHRKLMGDLAYLEVTMMSDEDEEEPTIFITACTTGFYVNKSTRNSFDPAPLPDHPCFSHELLDCLLLKSPKFVMLWTQAVAASKERAEYMNTTNKDGPFSSLFRVAVRGDFDGYQNPATASAMTGIDALLQTPSWLTPLPIPRSATTSTTNNKITAASSGWKHYRHHPYNYTRMEEDLCSTFGVDIRSGAVRDWNEELQSAREMPITTLQERIERAR